MLTRRAREELFLSLALPSFGESHALAYGLGARPTLLVTRSQIGHAQFQNARAGLGLEVTTSWTRCASCVGVALRVERRRSNLQFLGLCRFP